MDIFTERDYRCEQGYELFFKGDIVAGRLKIKPRRYGELFNMRQTSDKLSSTGTHGEIIAYESDRTVEEYLTDERLSLTKKEAIYAQDI